MLHTLEHDELLEGEDGNNSADVGAVTTAETVGGIPGILMEASPEHYYYTSVFYICMYYL